MLANRNVESVIEALPAMAREWEPYLLECRRTLHRLAEVSGQEFKTAAFLREKAEKLGLEVEKVSDTGLLVTLDTGRDGNGVALRADIDGLPVQEASCNMTRPRTVLSDTPGVCHACGHDAHMAMLLTAMQILTACRDQLCGRVYFCFEEGEESGSGWEGMVNALAKRPVNTVFGLHVYSALEHGKLSIEAGPRMAGTVQIVATFLGKGGHGSRPDLSINPVFAASNALCNLTVACANQLDVNQTVTLGFTGISGSPVYNVIPDEATVLGSMRFFDPTEGQKATDLMRSVFTHTAEMHRCRMDFHNTGILMDPLINDKDASELATDTLSRVLPEGTLQPVDKWYASESFSEYLKRYKGVFGLLGIRNEELGCCAEHHNAKFDLDESALLTGALAHAAYAVRALGDPAVAEWTYKL